MHKSSYSVKYAPTFAHGKKTLTSSALSGSFFSDFSFESVQFSPGIRQKNIFKIIPIFYPFMGCEKRCVFCGQDKQTGSNTDSGPNSNMDKENILKRLTSACTNITQVAYPEIAFYGGTFTLWPKDLQISLLEHAALLCQNSKKWRIRASTRPAPFGANGKNPLEKKWLQKLQSLGLYLLELGVQSFSTKALNLSARAYDEEEAVLGCMAVKKAGLKLGVQLMPGMPGLEPQFFLQDVEKALSLKADYLRFYPCLVIEGTELANMWRGGKYKPWDIQTTVQTLAKALSLCWQAKTPVIRMGLAPELSLQKAILAGPWLPDLGNRVQSQALILEIMRCAGGRKISRLSLPKYCQGMLGGEKSPFWSGAGIIGLNKEKINWHDAAYASVYFE